MIPFTWVYPIIYNLPEDCLIMINSPIPIIIGLNMTSEFVMKNVIKTSENLNEKIFVFLDEKLLYLN